MLSAAPSRTISNWVWHYPSQQECIQCHTAAAGRNSIALSRGQPQAARYHSNLHRSTFGTRMGPEEHAQFNRRGARPASRDLLGLPQRHVLLLGRIPASGDHSESSRAVLHPQCAAERPELWAAAGTQARGRCTALLGIGRLGGIRSLGAAWSPPSQRIRHTRRVICAACDRRCDFRNRRHSSAASYS